MSKKKRKGLTRAATSYPFDVNTIKERYRNEPKTEMQMVDLGNGYAEFIPATGERPCGVLCFVFTCQHNPVLR